MKNLVQNFFEAYFSSSTMRAVYAEGRIPKDMMASNIDEDGWFKWKALTGNLSYEQYKKIEDKFEVSFPISFVEWHKTYYFLDADCSIVRLPCSNSQEPLLEIIDNLDYDIARDLVKLKLFPFAFEANDSGPLVFDGREERINNEYAIRVYDYNYRGDLEGLSEIIFSSFTKLLECITHFLIETRSRKHFEVIPEFFQIDPNGAGKSGIDYWLGLSNILQEKDEYFSDI